MSWILGAAYCGLIWLFFAKLKLIRLSLPIVIVLASVGPSLIIALLFCAQYFHPFTGNAIAFEQIVPIATGVSQRGRVIEVAVKPNTPVKSGDVLFRVDPTPYQNTLQQLAASLNQAKQSKRVAEASVEQSEANLNRAMSDLEFATKQRRRQQELIDKNASSKQALEKTVNAYNQASNALTQANLSLSQARLAVDSAATQIESIQSQSDTAQYNLEQATVVAPGNGFVTNLQLQEGAMVGAVSGPVMSFVLDATDENQGVVVASFGQKNYLKIKEGQFAEIALHNYPGNIFKSRVLTTIDVSGAGQLTPSGVLPTQLTSGQPASFAVRIRLDDADSIKLPGGTHALVAVYTEDFQLAGIPIMFLIRAQSWMNYLI